MKPVIGKANATDKQNATRASNENRIFSTLKT
jgi:hypothetical protein